MKFYYSNTLIGIIALICLCFISCEKGKSDICMIEIVDSKNSILITQDENEVISALSRSPYNILNNIQIYGITEINDNGLRVNCYQFSNNLKVFSNPLVCIYKSGSYSHYIGDVINNSIELNTIADMIIDEVVDIYVTELNNDEAISEETREITMDNCLNCEFGYWDLNVSTGNNEMDFVKAWKVNPTDSSIPYAIIGDSTGHVIYYDNGIRY